MAWVGMDGSEAPVPMSLIAKALGLFKYIVQGQVVPYIEVKALREKTKMAERKASYKYKTELRQTIGQMTLSGQLTIVGRNAGVKVMEILCSRKDGQTLSVILELSTVLNFTLGGYNLKEMTSLALRADLWLDEMRGHNSDKEIEQRQRVEMLRAELIDFLASIREENYALIMRARKNRHMKPVLDRLAEDLRQKAERDRETEKKDLERQITESWSFLRSLNSSGTSVELKELDEITAKIPMFERALQKLASRLEKRREKKIKAEQKLGRELSEKELMLYEISEEEEKWRKETELKLASLRKRTDYLWSIFHQNQVAEIDVILSAHHRHNELIEELQGEDQ